MKQSSGPRALVLFGSASDAAYVDPIMAALTKAGFNPYLEYVSAHRNPARLEEVLKTVSADVIVAGAGLAAHLPGVVASKVQKPVIGVPVDVNFGGMDALMSIVQMPPGIPVLTLPMTEPKGMAKFIESTCKRMTALASHQNTLSVRFVGDKKTLTSDLTKKARAILDAAKVSWTVDSNPERGCVNIVAIADGKFPAKTKLSNDMMALIVPVYKPTKVKKTASAVELLKNMKAAKASGLWCGANNFVNAVCGALQLIAMSQSADSKFDSVLIQVKKGEFRG